MIMTQQRNSIVLTNSAMPGLVKIEITTRESIDNKDTQWVRQ